MQTQPGQVPMETPDTTETGKDQYIDRDIPIELIDEPEIATRETMDPEALAELAISIKEVGLLNKIIVDEKNGRYPVHAGHRRLLACRLAELQVVPCRIRQKDGPDGLAILEAENAWRENVNPVEQARFYQRLLVERCENDVDKLCERVKRRRNFVEGRLLLLMGNPAVCAAVEAGKLTLSVAEELNKIQDPGRLTILLDVSIQSGATARQVAEWARQGAALGNVYVPPPAPAGTPAELPPTAGSNPMRCLFCEGEEYPHMMEMFFIHGPCKKILDRMLQRSPAPPDGSEG